MTIYSLNQAEYAAVGDDESVSSHMLHYLDYRQFPHYRYYYYETTGQTEVAQYLFAPSILFLIQIFLYYSFQTCLNRINDWNLLIRHLQQVCFQKFNYYHTDEQQFKGNGHRRLHDMRSYRTLPTYWFVQDALGWIMYTCSGSKHFCFIILSILLHCHSLYPILLAFTFCYRFVIFEI